MEIIDEKSMLDALERVKQAQKEFATFSQEQVDKIFKAAALAANHARLPLAKMAVEETRMGIVEDKVIKNHFASEFVYNKYKNTKTCGVLEYDAGAGITKIAEPIGVIAAIIPTTNPTSTTIFKILLALKTRNTILVCPHPRAKKCTIEAAKIMLDAAVGAGAPKDIIIWIGEPSKELSAMAMKESDFILATGGPGMVKAAYSSGTPAIGVGAGNTPALIDDTADVKMAVNSVIMSKTFDHGVICASEQSIVVMEKVYEQVKQEFIDRGCHVMSKEEADKVRKLLFGDGYLNGDIVGQPAKKIADMAGIKVGDDVKVLIAEIEKTDKTEGLSCEKLSPVLGMFKAKTFENAVDICYELVEKGGLGHTAVIYVDTVRAREKLDRFSEKMKAGRILVNSPSSHGAIGDLYNFRLEPSLTLGCGSWGGNSVSENVGVKHLMNIKTVAERRENMLWFKAPSKVYHRRGCLPVALDEIKHVLGKKRVFIVTDSFLFKNGILKPVEDKLNEMGVSFTVFSDVEPDPTLASCIEGARQMKNFEPDCVIAFGGGSPMDAAKMMWLFYEYPEVKFEDLAMRFIDIRKRVAEFPKMGSKIYFIAIPTTAGTGSEVTPFTVITDERTGGKYPIASYEMMPNMAIIDADLMMHKPKGLTAASGFDVFTHAIEAYVSMLATPYTDSLALESIKLVAKYLKRAYDNGPNDPEARTYMADASAMAGMAFANAFLGVCHSMAHKLGGAFDLPHGIANALMIEEVIAFNSCDAPVKMGTFPQYQYPDASSKYATVADALSLGGKTKEEKIGRLISWVAKLKKSIGIKASIKEYGVTEADFERELDKMVEDAFDDQCTGANPRFPLMTEIRQMYLNAFHGKK